MAIWQCTVQLVNQDFEQTEKDPVFNTVNSNSIQRLDGFLSKGSSWSNALHIYGDIDSTCVILGMESGKTEEVSIRFDLRTLTKDILDGLWQFIKSNDAKLLSNGQVFDGTYQNLINILKNSKANLFCNNPIGFLESIKEES